jgi:hypothetical protein
MGLEPALYPRSPPETDAIERLTVALKRLFIGLTRVGLFANGSTWVRSRPPGT